MKTFTKFFKIFTPPYAMVVGVLALLLSCGTAWAQSATATPIRVPLGAAARYGLLSGDSIITDRAASVVGKAGAYAMPTWIRANDSLFANGGNRVTQALNDLQTARNYCTGLSGQSTNGLLGNQTLGSGVFTVTGSATCATGTTLTINGDSSSRVVLVISGNLTFAAGSNIVLNGIRPEHLFWCIGGNVSSAVAIPGIFMTAGNVVMQWGLVGHCAVLSLGKIVLAPPANFGLTATFYAEHSAVALTVLPTPVCTFAPQACNMIQDGSFECPSACPQGAGYGFGATYWGNAVTSGSFVAPINMYHSDSNADPYYRAGGVPINECNATWPYAATSPVGVAPVPAFAQHSTALNGNGYLGLTAGSVFNISTSGTSPHRSYAKQGLLQPIVAGRRYYGEFYNFLAPYSDYTATSLGFGLNEGDPPASLSGLDYLNILPQQVVYGVPSTSATNWQRISRVFRANTRINNPYLVIGDMSPAMGSAALTNHRNNGPGGGQGYFAGFTYYLIDNVLLAPFPESAEPGQTNLTYCGGGPDIQLGTCPLPGQIGTITYSWRSVPADPGFDHSAAQPLVHPVGNTMYWLTVTIVATNNGIATTTTYPESYPVTVTVTPPTAGPAQTIPCGGGTTSLIVNCPSPVSGVVYSWRDIVTGAVVIGNPATVTPTTITSYQLTAATASGAPVAIGLPNATNVTVLAAVLVSPAAQSTACGGPVRLEALCAGPGVALSWRNNQTGVVTPGNPVTLYPTASTTYSLIVTGSGGVSPIPQPLTTVTVNGGQPCIPVQCIHSYKQNAAGTYVNPRGPTYSNAELGNPTPLAPITQLSGNMVFDGIYHVVGPLELLTGKFDVRPGTVFYIDGGRKFPGYRLKCFQNELDDHLRILVSGDAVLTVSGAEFTSTCDDMWGGIEVLDKGRLVITKDFAGKPKRRSAINHARVAVMAGCDANNSNGTYYLTGTDFKNDTYGVVALGNRHDMTPDKCQVYDCRFTSDRGARLAPDNNQFTQTGLLVRGDYHRGIPYQYNTFTSVLVGADVAGNNMVFDFNQFADCYAAAIRVGGSDVTYRIQALGITDNKIDVPDLVNPGGQVALGAEVKGIDMPYLAASANAGLVYVNTNEISSASPPGNLNKIRIGLDSKLSFRASQINLDNSFTRLDHGVRLFDAVGNYPGEQISGNAFAQCANAVTLTGVNFAPFSPMVSCNDIDADVGINITPAANVGDLGTPTAPCGNNYGATPVAIKNNGLNDGSSTGPALTYYAYFRPGGPVTPSVLENLNGLTSAVIQLLVTAPYTCSQQGASHGLNRSASGGSGYTQADVQDWQKRLLGNAGNSLQLHTLEYPLVRYYEQADQLNDLESFVNQLPYQNDAAFERLSIYLMETYRRTGNDSAAQRVRGALGILRGDSEEISTRLAYFDLAGRLQKLGAGNRPDAADSTQLVDLANAGTAYATVACASLRYYYPQLTCDGKDGTAQPQARAARPGTPTTVTPSTAKPSLRAYPNPASETLTVTATGPVPAEATFELLALGSGRVVLRQPAGHAVAGLTVPVAGLAPGVYAGRLALNGQLLSTCKIVVVH